MSNFFKTTARNAPVVEQALNAVAPARRLAAIFAYGVERKRKMEEEAALRALQAQGEEAAIYNRSALAVGASQAQQHAHALADAALTTPSEKPEVVTGTQAKRKRGGVTIRI